MFTSFLFCMTLLCCHGYLGQMLQPLVERVRLHLTTVMRAEGAQQCSHEGPWIAMLRPGHSSSFPVKLVQAGQMRAYFLPPFFAVAAGTLGRCSSPWLIESVCT